jgi:hypothetical protein
MASKLVGVNLKTIDTLDVETLTFVNMVCKFLQEGDRLVEFNIDGCVSSSFFNELSLESHTIIVHENSNSQTACTMNRNETKSKYTLSLNPPHTDLLAGNPTALVLGYAASPEIQKHFVSLCTECNSLRLVVIESDIDTKHDFVLSVFNVLKQQGFYPHVSGKYLVMVKGEERLKVVQVKKSTRPIEAIIALAVIVFFVLAVLGVRRMFWS